jgi:uncharacterized protein (DUF983 family)
MHAEIRTRIPDTVSWDYHFEHAGDTPVTFTVRVLAILPPFLFVAVFTVTNFNFKCLRDNDSSL